MDSHAMSAPAVCLELDWSQPAPREMSGLWRLAAPSFWVLPCLTVEPVRQLQAARS